MQRHQIFIQVLVAFLILVVFFVVTFVSDFSTNDNVPISHSHHVNDVLIHEEFSPTVASDQLRKNVLNDPNVLMTGCHAEAHSIGHNAYLLLGEGAYLYADPMCGGGYLHGVTEQAFESNGLVYLQKIVHEQCTGDILESCLHGVGHGIHQATDNIETAVVICGQVAASGTDCFDGVFMDAFDTEGNTEKNVITLQEAYGVCENTTSEAENSCYFYLPRVMGIAAAAAIVDVCAGPQIKNGWGACAMGSGVFS